MTDYVIDVRDLRKTFGERRVVDGLTLQVAAGEICGFLGANGSGKTTTIRLLCGLLTPDGGEGTCLGFDIRREARQIRRHIGYMTQKFCFYEDLTVTENLDLVAGIYELPNARAGGARGSSRNCSSADLRRQLAGQLSGGWKQRLALAACVLHRPKLLLLDEPTAGVDAKARRDFWDLIHDMAAEGLTVLASTHYMDEAERCKRVVYLAGGRIVVQGDAQEVARQSGLVTFEATGAGVDEVARQMRRHAQAWKPPPYSAAPCMSRGRDRAALEAAIGALSEPALWREVEPRLEDVFIHQLADEEERHEPFP